MKYRLAGTDGDNEAGFTLVEMLVALTILGLIVGLGAGALARRDPAPTPRQVAERLQAIIVEARSDALRTGRQTSVSVDLQARTFAYPSDAAPLRLPPQMSVTGSLAQPLVGESAPGLVFRADGSSSGADLDFTSERHMAKLEVSWLTGLPRLTVVPAP